MFDLTEEQKNQLTYSAIGAALFFVLSLPQTYNLTNYLANFVRLSTVDSAGPTMTGIILHSFVYLALTYAVMQFKSEEKEKE